MTLFKVLCLIFYDLERGGLVILSKVESKFDNKLALISMLKNSYFFVSY